MATWSRTQHNGFYQMAYRIRAAALAVLSAVFLGGVWVQWVLPPPKAMLPLPVITFDDGHGWFAKLPRFPSSSWQRRLYIIHPDDSVPNGVTLYEDGRPLPFPDSELHDIRDAGEGRHSRLGDAVYFSASDNGDPTSGGRVYEVEIRTRPRARVMALIVLSAVMGLVLAISLSRRLTRFAGVGAAFAASLSRRLARSAASLSCRLAQSLFRGAAFAASLSRRLARSAASLSCCLAQSLFRGAAFAAFLSRRLAWSLYQRACRFMRLLDSHAAIIIFFAVFSVLVYWGRTGGNTQNIHLGGDAGLVACMAAALDHSEAFGRDPVFSHPEWFEFYHAFHVHWLRFVRPWFESYAHAYVWLILPCVFLHLAGYYLLGLAMGWSRRWSAALSGILLMTFWAVPYETYWGFFIDPQPRFLFAAMAGFLFAAAMRWKDRPWRWIPVMIGVGVILNFHMVSGPTAAMMLWAGFLFSSSGLSRRGHFGYLFGLGLLYLLVALPGIVIYGGSGGYFNHPDPGMRRLILERYENFSNVPWGVYQFLIETMGRTGLGLIGAAGALLVWKLGRERESGRFRVWLGWCAGVVFAAFLVPLADMAVSAMRDRGPMTIDLVRGLRFFIFLALFAAVWGAREASAFFQRRWGRTGLTRLAALLALAATLTFCYVNQPIQIQKPWSLAWDGVRVVLERPAAPSSTAELHEAIKRLPEGTLILPLGIYGLNLRHETLRPVAATHNDFNLYTASKGDELREFISFAAAAEGVDPAFFGGYGKLAEKCGLPVPEMPVTGEERLARVRLLGEMSGADVYVLPKGGALALTIPDLGPIIWENTDYALIARSEKID